MDEEDGGACAGADIWAGTGATAVDDPAVAAYEADVAAALALALALELSPLLVA